MDFCGLQQHQSQLIQQMGKYNNAAEEYNLMKLVSQYRNAINSAENPEEARSFAAKLEGVLAQQGKGLGDISGINSAKLNDNAIANPLANGAKPAGGCKSCHGCGACGKKAHQGKALDLRA
jgi:hypothetical protein